MVRRILVAYDFSPIAARALAWAEELARGLGATITLLNVQVVLPPVVGPVAALPMAIPPPDQRNEIAARLREVAAMHGVQGGAEVINAVNVGAAIVERARELPADLIVMGTHGRGAIARAFLGSVADHVVRHADCPVVTLRGQRAEPAGSPAQRG